MDAWLNQWEKYFEAVALWFYLMTLGFGPAVVGWVFGRWLPVYLRVLPLAAVLAAGYWWMRYSARGFEIYLLGNLLYVLCTISGLSRRAKQTQVWFWDLNHFDWITAAIATVLSMILYTKPHA